MESGSCALRAPHDDSETIHDGLPGLHVLVTGGQGFIGSNLVLRLLNSGCRVTVVDAAIRGSGSNPFNLDMARKRIQFLPLLLGRDSGLVTALAGVDVVLHCAALCDHQATQTVDEDLSGLNLLATQALCEAMDQVETRPCVIFASTRGVYGRPQHLPVAESAPLHPLSAYERGKIYCEEQLSTWAHDSEASLSILRLSNVFGPRAQVAHERHGVANWFIRLAMTNQVIPLFGGGRYLRDFLYIEDCVAAMMAAILHARVGVRVFNIGNEAAISYREYATRVVSAVGRGRVVPAPYTAARSATEVGDYQPDISAARRYLDWSPQWSLDRALSCTVAYYEQYLQHY